MAYNRKYMLFTLSAAAMAGFQAQARDTARPNVVFILLDDAGYCDFGCYGQTRTETPNIDSLASRGMRFTSMYSGAPQSAPSRCGLLTGLHNGHTQIRSNDEQAWRGNIKSLEAMELHPELEGQAPLKEGTVTIGTKMQEGGYRTAMVGKWGLGGPHTASVPNRMGFDFYYGYLCQRHAQTYYPRYLYRNMERDYVGNDLMELGSKLGENDDPMDPRSYDRFEGKVYSPDAMYRQIEAFLDEESPKPFFLMWTTTIPHSAMQAPRKFVEYYVNKFGDETPVSKLSGYYPCRYPRATYAAMISYLDWQIGNLVQKLRKMGIYDNTIIIITSDNGPAQSHLNSSAWFDNSHPFHSDPGYTKRTLHEGGIRMPFIVTWGDRYKGKVSDHVAWFPDMMPTFCDMAGVVSPDGDGVSMWPLLNGKARAQKAHEWLYWEFPAFRNERGFLAVRIGKWKGLVRNVADGGNHMEIYEIDRDPLEEHDLSKDHPELVERMWEIIRREHTVSDNPIFNTPVNFPQNVR